MANYPSFDKIRDRILSEFPDHTDPNQAAAIEFHSLKLRNNKSIYMVTLLFSNLNEQPFIENYMSENDNRFDALGEALGVFRYHIDKNCKLIDYNVLNISNQTTTNHGEQTDK